MTAGSRAVVVAAVLVSLAAGGCRKDRVDWRVQQLYGGEGSIAALEGPTSVLAFRVEPRRSQPEPGVNRVGDFRTTSDAVEVPPDVAKRIADILLASDTYDWLRAKSEPPSPSIGLRYIRHTSRVDVVLCVETNQLFTYRHDRQVWVEDFDAARERLVPMLEALFADKR